jgi:hypothetical protein
MLIGMKMGHVFGLNPNKIATEAPSDLRLAKLASCDTGFFFRLPDLSRLQRALVSDSRSSSRGSHMLFRTC